MARWLSGSGAALESSTFSDDQTGWPKLSASSLSGVELPFGNGLQINIAAA